MIPATGQTPRVVITGIGLVTGLGPDRESSWRSLLAGDGAIGRLDPAGLWPELMIPNQPGPAVSFLGAKAKLPPVFTGDVFLAEPNIRLALAAADEAVRDAGIDWDEIELFRRGCVIGTSKGGMRSISRALAEREYGSESQAQEELWPMFWPNTPASLVAERFRIRGPVLCPVAACATGLMSLWRGAELIRQGACDLVLAGSSDASLEPAVLGAFSRMGVLAKDADDPSTACRPFDLDRSGFVVGEGAAVLVLERADVAESRGRAAYAEWLAGGAVSDPSGIAHVNPNADELAWLIGNVLQQAMTRADQIDYLNLHGTGTRGNDLAETRAIRRAFGPQAEGISCSSVKGAIGHLLGAAGSVEMAFTLLAMRDGRVPATRNLTRPDPQCDLDYTPREPRTRPIKYAMKLSLGFGGHQVAAVLGPAP